MKKRFAVLAAATALLGIAALQARAAEATFNRDLTVNGRVDLTVATGAGTIHLIPCAAGNVHISARVKSNRSGADEKVEEIVAHPPIEQTGNIVRIGAHRDDLHNISIDYEIQAPADSFLNASSGSGGVTDDGVGVGAKLSTGSGSIHATGLQGGFTVDTGSGSIEAEAAGAGDVKAETGSGSIDLKDVRGGLHAHTGSGGIKVAGTPSAPWRIGTGSGGVEIWTGNAGFMLDAESGSGGIHSDREIAMQGSLQKHRVVGKIGEGGAEVRVSTGSGGIRIH
jgi:hypothetical protein